MNLKNKTLEDMAKRVLGKPETTQEELLTLFNIDLRMIPDQLVVSAAETRQVRQYESNNYHCSLSYDLSSLKQYIVDEVAKADDKDKVEVFVNLKKSTLQMISDKYAKTEDYLRGMIQKQEAEDGIKR